MTADSPLLGRTLAGRFRIDSLLGEGGMATVYRGTQEEEPREIAIKIMNADLASDPKFVRRFRREAKSAARLEHENTVRIFDYGVEDGLPFIAMELLRGVELVQILHHERRLSEQRAAKIMIQVANALAAAHEEGIVHRDLKPENIMILRDPADPGVDRVKVLDFGIAKILDRDASKGPEDPNEPPPSSLGKSALTLMGTIVGTPEYMSPEQSRGGTIDARSDVYACGVLLYHLVTGRVPFSAELPVETALLHVTEAPAPPSDHVPAIHPKLEALVLQALEKSPEARPQSARELMDRLTALLPELSADPHKLLGPSVPTKAALEVTQPEAGAAPAGAEKKPDLRTPPGGIEGAKAAAAAVKILEAGAATPAPAAKPTPTAKPTSPKPRRAPPPPKGLSPIAGLLVGAGIGVLILALAALILLRG